MIRRRADAQPKQKTILQSIIQLAALPIVGYVLLNFIFRSTYTVHDNGIIIISGASTGIGRDAAEHLALKGYHVFAGVRKESDAQSIRDTNIKTLHPLMLDVTQHESCVNAVKEVEQFAIEEKLPVVALVNNAGIARMQTAEFHSLEDSRTVFDTNFFGAVDLTQQTLPLLRNSKGRILMISSVAGFIAAPFHGIYSGSKYALEGFSDALRREVAEFEISVSIIQPGYVKTAIQGKQNISPELVLYSKSGAREGFTGEEVVSVYPHLYNEKGRLSKKKQMDSASSVDVTTNAIIHAITNPHPHTRYPVASGGGFPAWVLSWVMWALPDRVEDFMVLKLA